VIFQFDRFTWIWVFCHEENLKILQILLADSTIVAIGNVDINEAVHFYVSNPGELVSANQMFPISYDNNIVGHEAMSADTFTAPVAGTYQFYFHCQASTSEVDGEEVNKKTKVALLVQGREVSFTEADGYYWARQSLSLTATLELFAGDKVQTRFDFGKIHDAYFGGTLLEKAKVIDP
jgi:C1q domain